MNYYFFMVCIIVSFDQFTQRYVGSVVNWTDFDVVASYKNRTVILKASRDNTVRSQVKSPLAPRLVAMLRCKEPTSV